jgi:hypothetical protein
VVRRDFLLLDCNISTIPHDKRRCFPYTDVYQMFSRVCYVLACNKEGAPLALNKIARSAIVLELMFY